MSSANAWQPGSNGGYRDINGAHRAPALRAVDSPWSSAGAALEPSMEPATNGWRKAATSGLRGRAEVRSRYADLLAPVSPAVGPHGHADDVPASAPPFPYEGDLPEPPPRPWAPPRAAVPAERPAPERPQAPAVDRYAVPSSALTDPTFDDLPALAQAAAAASQAASAARAAAAVAAAEARAAIDDRAAVQAAFQQAAIHQAGTQTPRAAFAPSARPEPAPGSPADLRSPVEQRPPAAPPRPPSDLRIPPPPPPAPRPLTPPADLPATAPRPQVNGVHPHPPVNGTDPRQHLRAQPTLDERPEYRPPHAPPAPAQPRPVQAPPPVPQAAARVVEAPVPPAPIPAAPVSAAPVSVAPVSAAPVSAAPVSAVPVSAAPVSAAPVSGSPVSSAPIHAGPVPAPPLPQRIPAPPDVPEIPEDGVDDQYPDVIGPGRLAVDKPDLARIATGLRYKDDFEQQAAPPIDGFDFAAVQAAVRKVPGVRDAEIKPNASGVHTLRLDLDEGADPAMVSRMVARLLKQKMGLAAEPRRAPAVPKVPVDPGLDERTRQRHPVTPLRTRGADEAEHRRPLRPGTGPRVILDQVQVSTLGMDATVEVRLTGAGSPAIGVASGPAVDGYVLRLAAVAATSAIDQLLSRVTGDQHGRSFVEHAAVVPFGSCEVAVTVVLLAYGGTVEQLTGSALVAGDPRQAVVRATLAAVNRRLDALLG